MERERPFVPPTPQSRTGAECFLGRLHQLLLGEGLHRRCAWAKATSNWRQGALDSAPKVKQPKVAIRHSQSGKIGKHSVELQSYDTYGRAWGKYFCPQLATH